MAILEQWNIFETNGSQVAVGGLVYDDKRYQPGQRLVTDPVVSISDEKVTTSSGEEFYFGNPHPLFLELFPQLFTPEMRFKHKKFDVAILSTM